MTTEPTDDELAKLFTEETGFDVDDFPAAILDFARAARVKWGQPSGAGGPVALLVRKNSWRDGQWEAAPPNSPSYGLAWANQRVYVYTAPQSTQAVPPAGREQITADDLAQRAKVGAIHTDRNDNVVLRRHSYREQMEGRFERGWREAEKYHGIKGKGAGNADQ